jgi:hypothetical protein
MTAAFCSQGPGFNPVTSVAAMIHGGARAGRRRHLLQPEAVATGFTGRAGGDAKAAAGGL